MRDRVFALLMEHKFRFQYTSCEKSKAQPQVRSSRSRFFKYPWFYHFKHGIAPHLKDADKLIVTAASLGNKKEKATYVGALRDVTAQSAPKVQCVIDFRQNMADEMLQVADYCAWAVQRKIERGDSKSFDIIKERLSYSYDLWGHGTKHYY